MTLNLDKAHPTLHHKMKQNYRIYLLHVQIYCPSDNITSLENQSNKLKNSFKDDFCNNVRVVKLLNRNKNKAKL